VFLVGMGVTIYFQTLYLNMALQLADVMTVFPVFQAFWISFGTIGGLVFYHRDTEMESYSVCWLLTAACCCP
jgi:hypothetical protein